MLALKKLTRKAEGIRTRRQQATKSLCGPFNAWFSHATLDARGPWPSTFDCFDSSTLLDSSTAFECFDCFDSSTLRLLRLFAFSLFFHIRQTRLSQPFTFCNSIAPAALARLFTALQTRSPMTLQIFCLHDFGFQDLATLHPVFFERESEANSICMKASQARHSASSTCAPIEIIDDDAACSDSKCPPIEVIDVEAIGAACSLGHL